MAGKKNIKKAADDAGSGKTDADRTRQNILDIATDEFATNGLSGARVDEIADRTRTSKRMIYYYFGGKDGLYLAVLENAYSSIRAEEAQSDLTHLPPRQALSRLIELTFDYDENHRKFVSLVSIENIHRAEYLSKLPSIRKINQSVIGTLEDILKRGQREGIFRTAIDAVDLHLMITAFCFFRVSNRYTFEVLFDCNFSNPKVRNRQRRMIIETILRFVETKSSSNAHGI